MDDDLKQKLERLKRTWESLEGKYAPIPEPGHVDHGHHHHEGPPTPLPPHEKKAGVVGRIKSLASGTLGSAEKRQAAIEIGGLGMLAVPGADHLQAAARARLAGDKSEHASEKRRLRGDGMHAAIDVGGLGVLAAPEFKHFKHAAIACLDELTKLGEQSTVSEEEARRSLDRLETLERNKPTAGQVGRYATLGALAGPAVGAVGNVIKGRGTFDFSGASKLRGIAGESAKGALSMGAVPLVRGALDRHGEEKKLRRYVSQAPDHSPVANDNASEMPKAAMWRQP